MAVRTGGMFGAIEVRGWFGGASGREHGGE